MGQFDGTKLDQVIAGLTVIRQIAAGEEPALSNGWSLGDPKRNPHKDMIVLLAHEDRVVMGATRASAAALGLVASMERGINPMEFLAIYKSASS